MDEKGLTGNDMFNMVKEECERIINPSNSKTNKTENNNTLYVSLNNNEPKWTKSENKNTFGKYDGQIGNNIPNGFGLLKLDDGIVYEGDWLNGKYHGKGELTLGSGKYEEEKYIGDFKNGFKDGVGTYFHKNGSKYEGQWKKDKPHGKGIFNWSSGGRYEGDFKMGLKHGWGKEKLSGKWDGDKYEGEYKFGEMTGKGIYLFKNGKKIKGDWLNGKSHGSVKIIYKNGNRYEGQTKNDYLDGYGIYFITNGYYYKGIWKKDKPWDVIGYDDNNKKIFIVKKGNGSGTFIFLNGEKYNGEFRNGKKYVKLFKQPDFIVDRNLKIGVFYKKNNKSNWSNYRNKDSSITYIGQYKNDNPHGLGYLEISNIHNYIGQFKNGKIEGYGIEYIGDMIRYSYFIDGEMNGIGSLVTSSVSWMGDFVNDELWNGVVVDELLFILEYKKDGQSYFIEKNDDFEIPVSFRNQIKYFKLNNNDEYEVIYQRDPQVVLINYLKNNLYIRKHKDSTSLRNKQKHFLDCCLVGDKDSSLVWNDEFRISKNDFNSSWEIKSKGKGIVLFDRNTMNGYIYNLKGELKGELKEGWLRKK